MNRIEGFVSQIDTYQQLSVVTLEVGNIFLKTIVVDSPESSPLLQLGKKVVACFKETEVTIGLGTSLPISLQNQLPLTVSSIEKGKLLSRVGLQGDFGMLTAIIGTEALVNLDLMVGLEVTALIKMNDIIIRE